MTDPHAELEALKTRAACEEARKQAAIARRDWPAARDAEIELSRLWARHCELERHSSSAA